MLQILIKKISIEPVATLSPASEQPMLQLQGQPSGSNISNASSPSNPLKETPPLLGGLPALTPPLPTDDNVAHPFSWTGPHDVSLEERHPCSETNVQE